MQRPPEALTCRCLAFCLLLWATLVGCDGLRSGPSPAPERVAAFPPKPHLERSQLPAPLRDVWEVFLLRGSRAGYGHTTVERLDDSPRPQVRIESIQQLKVQRSGQTTAMQVRLVATETADGQLLEFLSEIQTGPGSARTQGHVEGNRLHLEITTRAKTDRSSIPWSAEFRGPFAVQQSLWERPLKPGDRRSLQALDALTNQVCTFQLTAHGFEPVELLAGSYRLLRIEVAQRFPSGQQMQLVAWADTSGDVLKTFSRAMELQTVRCDKTIALQESALPDVDLVADTLVKLSQPLPHAHQTKSVRYRVHLEEGDPAQMFAADGSQEVKSIDPHTAEVTVYAIRPGSNTGPPQPPADPATDDDLKPNNIIQSDHALIRADAQRAAQGLRDPWQIALALESFVHRELASRRFSFTQAFATAAEVAETREGDCSENAVYLTALARACGIPARVAVGLVYLAHQQAFGYHMWSEVYIDGQWIPLDATLGQGGIGAAHLKVARSNLAGTQAYVIFVPLVNIISQLQIEVLAVDGHQLP